MWPKSLKQCCLSIFFNHNDFGVLVGGFWLLLVLEGLVLFRFYWVLFTHSLLLTRKTEVFSHLEITRPNPTLTAKPSF